MRRPAPKDAGDRVGRLTDSVADPTPKRKSTAPDTTSRPPLSNGSDGDGTPTGGPPERISGGRPCPLPCIAHQTLVTAPSGHVIATDCSLCGQRIRRMDWRRELGRREL